jgi:hypothetical protein
MGHPFKLAADGLAMRVDMSTRNALCAFQQSEKRRREAEGTG